MSQDSVAIDSIPYDKKMKKKESIMKNVREYRVYVEEGKKAFRKKVMDINDPDDPETIFEDVKEDIISDYKECRALYKKTKDEDIKKFLKHIKKHCSDIL